MINKVLALLPCLKSVLQVVFIHALNEPLSIISSMCPAPRVQLGARIPAKEKGSPGCSQAAHKLGLGVATVPTQAPHALSEPQSSAPTSRLTHLQSGYKEQASQN